MNNVRNLLAGSLVYIACIVLLSLACNVSSGLPVADVIGQWLYFDKSALVVAGCLLMAGLMMEKRYLDRKSTRLNSSHLARSRMPSSA